MKLSPSKNRTIALTLVELLIVLALLAIVTALLLPAVSRPRMKSKRIGCVNNLKQVGLSFYLWAADNGDKFPMQVSVTNGGTMEFVASGLVFPHFQVMSNELSTPKIVACPEDKQRTAATNFTTDFNNSKVSYFIGLDANEPNPSMLLSGDGNLIANGVAVRRGFLALTTNSLVGWTSQIHSNRGNVCLADGHVDQLTSSRFQQVLKNSDVATNRLVLP